MRSIFLIILDALIAISLLALVRAELKVTQVHVLFRHGERTPLPQEMYPNDIHNVSEYEPWGFGQLTNAGKVREYKIGQLLKTRYKDLLGPIYLPHDVYAFSTGTDRTKMSLQLVLAGLFPPSEAQMWNSELPWIPIPTYYVPLNLDVVMNGHRSLEYQDTISEVRQLPEVRAKVAEHKEFLEFLTEKTGRNLTGPHVTFEVYNLLVAQKSLNLTLPEWCTDEVFQRMGELAALEYQIRSHTPKLRRLCGGPMVKTFIEDMCRNGAGGSPRKFHLYSGHETTIAGFLQAHGIHELKLPLYGTAVMLERLQDADGKLFVKLVLWTGVTERLIPLRLPGCEEICPIERYLELTSDVIPSKEEMNWHWRQLKPHDLQDILLKQIAYE